METIFALSSGSLPAGVAIVRISGPSSRQMLIDLVGSLPPPRQATLKSIRDRNQNIVDQALILYFPAPHSFTGQDCAELHLHGSRAVVAKVLSLLNAYPNARPAEAGEFTRLAMESGKLDLVEVEGLSDLLAAETEMQRRLALELSQGNLSQLYSGWMNRLTYARAMIEAELDFADEDDVPDSASDIIWTDMRVLLAELEEHLGFARIGEIIRDGLKVVLIGAPNVGKSSLLNFLSKREVAIVTPVPGTTRDILSVDLDIEGYAVTLVDTAGLRETDDPVEIEGIRRATAAAEQADVVLLLRPSTDAGRSRTIETTAKTILVGTMSDLEEASHKGSFDVRISTRTGEGIDDLLTLLIADLKEVHGAKSLAIPTRIRHVSLLREAANFIAQAIDSPFLDLPLRAENLRLAAHRLGRITGHIDAEDLLDVIFSRFCVGK